MSVRVSTLANGLRVATDRMDQVETVSLGVYIGVGTRQDLFHQHEHVGPRFFLEEVGIVAQARLPWLPEVLGREHRGRLLVVERVDGELRAGVGMVPDLVGRDVIVPAVLSCGQCAFCATGRENVCPSQLMPGNDIDGGFATHTIVPTKMLVPLPDDLGRPRPGLEAVTGRFAHRTHPRIVAIARLGQRLDPRVRWPLPQGPLDRRDSR